MNIKEMLEVVRESLDYVDAGCMDCLQTMPPDAWYRDSIRSGDFVSAYTPSWGQIRRVADAIRKIGLDPAEVDARAGTGLANERPRIGFCITPDEFMAIIKELLTEKEGVKV